MINVTRFAEASFNNTDGLYVSTESCGCCAEYYQSAYSYEPWKVSIESLDKYVKSEQKRLDALREFVTDQQAQNNAFFICEGEA